MTEQVEAYINGQKIQAELIDTESNDSSSKDKKSILKGGQVYNEFNFSDIPNNLIRVIPNFYKKSNENNTLTNFMIGLGIGAGAYFAISKLKNKRKRRRNKRKTWSFV